MRPWLRVVGALALLVASGVEARAQMGVVRGKVVDQEGEPVAEVVVRFEFLGGVDRHYETETNDKGAYTQVIASGPYRVTASKDGYRGSSLERSVSSGSPTELPTLEIVNQEAAAQAAMAPILKQFEGAAELANAGRLDEAVAAYRELEAEHPDIPELFFNLGTLYARQEKWPEAEAAFQRVLELDPGNPQAQVLLAEVHKNMGRGDEALAAMEKLIAETPGDAELHYNLGVFYLNAQRHEDAYAAFDEVRELDPDNVNVLYLLGTLSLNLGRIEQATGHLQAYLDRAPADGQYRDTAEELLSKLPTSEAEGQ